LPLLKSKHGDASLLNMYRGITLSSVVSKLFELVLLDYFEVFSLAMTYSLDKKRKVAV